MDNEIKFEAPVNDSIPEILKIFLQWIDNEEAEKYIDRIKASLDGKKEYGMCFYIMRKEDVIIGIGGLADPLPSILSYANSTNPGELKILYLDNQARGKGYGSKFLSFLEDKASAQGRTEMLVRSAEQFRETAFEFYKHSGYEDLGQIINDAEKPMELFRKVLSK